MAFSKVKVGGLADDSVTAANIDDDGTGYTVGNLTNSGTLQQTGQVTIGTGSGSGGSFTLPTSRGANDKYVLQIDTTAGAANWVESLVAPEIDAHNFDVSGSTDDGGINDYEAPYAVTGTTTNASTTISAITTTNIKAGQYISGAGIPANTTVSSISSAGSSNNGTIVISNQATAAASGVALKIQKTPGEKNGGKVILTGTNFGATIGDISVAITTSSGVIIANASYLSGLSGGTSITAEWTGTEGTYSTDLTSSYAGKIYFKMTKSGLASNVYDTGATLTSDATLSTPSQTGGDRTVAPSATTLGTYGTGRTAGGGQDSNTETVINFDRLGGTDIEDSSNTGGNGHKITASGNAVIKASPFGDGKTAMHFDGNDYLSVGTATHADFAVATNGSFTFECWFYMTTINSFNIFYAKRSSSNGLLIDYKSADTDLRVIIGSTTKTFSHTLVANQWYHLAVSRSSDQLSLYLDGSQVGTTQTSGGQIDSNTNALTIGGDTVDTRYLTGYIDEVRWVNGTAVYTSDFTVPTSRLTEITNTKLLIHSNQQITDSSPNNTAIYTQGTAGLVKEETNRGSGAHANFGSSAIYMDGTGDYLSFAISSDFASEAFGTPSGTDDDFTIEGWYRFDTIANELGFWGIDGASELSLYWYQPSDALTLRTNSGNLFAVTWNPSANTWYHIAFVRASTTSKVYINGSFISGATTTSALPAFSAGEIFEIGTDAYGTSRELQGYVDSFRISKVARYSANFTPSTSALTSDSNTIVLIQGDGGAIVDSATSGTTHTVTPTGAIHSQGHKGIAPWNTWPTNGKTHGSAGVYFDGDTSHGGDHILVDPAPINMTTSGANTTVEFWFYRIGYGHRMTLFRTPLFDKASQGLNFLFEIDASDNLKGWLLEDQGYTYSSGSNYSIYHVTNFITTFPNNQWHHFAFTHTGWGGGNTTVGTHGVARVYVNGKYVAPTGTDTTGFWRNKLIDHVDDNLSFGGSASGSGTNVGSFKGYIDGIRVSDTIRYTGTSTSEWGNTGFTSGGQTRAFGAFGQDTPDAGTITLVATGSGDYTWSEVAAGTALPGTLAVGSTTHSGSGDSRTHTATVTGSFSEDTTSTIVNGTRSDVTTNNILLKAQNDADSTKAITLGSSGGYDGIGIAQKSTEKPVLFNGRRYVGNTTGLRKINGLGFQPDFVWIKDRDGTNSYTLSDSVRGGGYSLYSNTAGSNDTTTNGITGFLDDGFQLGKAGTGNSNVGNNVNGDNLALIAWTWKAGGGPTATNDNTSGAMDANSVSVNGALQSSYTPSGSPTIYPKKMSVNTAGGFSIIQYTKNATAGATVPHGLSQAPEMIIVKDIGTSNNWMVYHKNAGQGKSNASSHYYLSLDQNIASTDSNTRWNDTAPSSSVVTLGDNGHVNGPNGPDYIMYCWHGVTGASAFGTYTGSTSSPYVTETIGFKPSFLMVKCISTTGDWEIVDSYRDSASPVTTALFGNLNNAESSLSAFTTTFTNTGFTFTSATTSGNKNVNNATYIYMAFA